MDGWMDRPTMWHRALMWHCRDGAGLRTFQMPVLTQQVELALLRLRTLWMVMPLPQAWKLG